MCGSQIHCRSGHEWGPPVHAHSYNYCRCDNKSAVSCRFCLKVVSDLLSKCVCADLKYEGCRRDNKKCALRKVTHAHLMLLPVVSAVALGPHRGGCSTPKKARCQGKPFTPIPRPHTLRPCQHPALHLGSSEVVAGRRIEWPAATRVPDRGFLPWPTCCLLVPCRNMPMCRCCPTARRRRANGRQWCSSGDDEAHARGGPGLTPRDLGWGACRGEGQ